MSQGKYILFVMAATFAFLPSGFAEDSVSLACDVTRDKNTVLSTLEATILDDTSSVKSTESGALGFDASLAPGSFIFVMQDQEKQQRVAFTGSPLAVSVEGSRLSTASAALGCRKKVAGNFVQANRPKIQLPNYLMCVLDEVIYTGGSITSTKREIVSQNSSMNFRLEQKVQEENARYAFSIRYLSFDPIRGLEVVLIDKKTGERAQFVGPGVAMVNSFLLGFTQGSRDADAKFLRLGCAYSADPALFADSEKK